MKKKAKKPAAKVRRPKKTLAPRGTRSGTPGLFNPTRRVEVDGTRTFTAYLSQKGINASMGLETSTTDLTASQMLRVEGGQKYTLGRMLAQGGMGAVHQARDLNCRRMVAMKLLPKGQQNQVEDLIRFIEEAQITSQLEHPNIVPIHELGLDADGNVFYTMKYVKGVTLTEILDSIRHGDTATIEQYPLARLLTIFQKVCDAIAFAHSRGVVHRDLKPDNIMVGGFGEVQVMDWGLGKVLRDRRLGVEEPRPPIDVPPVRVDGVAGGEEEEEQEEGIDSIRTDDIGTGLRTMSGRVMGTPGYMAPEQTHAAGTDVDPRSDVYSLGAILYSILTLRSSVRGKEIREVLRQIIHGDIFPPEAFNEPTPPAPDMKPVVLYHCPGRRIPKLLSNIVTKCMQVNPSDRYPSVTDLQRDLEAYQDGLVWHLVTEETFAGGDISGRWEIIGGQWEMRNGELRLHGGEPQMLLLRQDVTGDVRIEFECHLESLYLNDIGCFMSAVRSENRKEIPSSGYELKYGSYDNSLNVLSRSNQRIWSQGATPIERGKRYRVLAERIGSRLRMLVNGEEVIRFADPDPLSGPDRTAVGILGWMADTRYSLIRVYTRGTPLKSDLLDVAERHLQKGHYGTARDLFQEVIVSSDDVEHVNRARHGQEVAENRETMAAQLGAWRAKLEKAWPGAVFALRMDNDGLTLEVSNAGVVSLEPLRGMPLTSIYCAGNRIADLGPLKGLPLRALNCGGNPVAGLEPLCGMPLVTLLCECCRIESLEPLRGMPLTMLNCGGNRISSLEPLKGMPLTWLGCWGNRIGSLEPVSGMRLTALYCDANEIPSLKPLKGMPLTTLHCNGNRIRTLTEVSELPLTTLHCGCNALRDLEPLRGLRLTIFSCHCNQIKSLAPLRGMPLGSLYCGGNQLSGIESFIKNPPESMLFDCDTISTEELTWIHQTWSRDFRKAAHARHVEVLLASRKNDVNRLRSLAREFNGHAYLFMPRFMTWDEARAYCESLDGHLLTLSSREENDFVVSLLPGGSWFWMGLHTTEQGPQWVTGEPFGFAAFIDVLRERLLGPKVFFNGTWSYDVCYPGTRNPFMIEWE